MLKVYAAEWCPHCKMTVQFLKDKKIQFEYLNIEKLPVETVREVVKANDGKDDDEWVVPTLEFNGHWRPGKVFDPDELKTDLEKMGVKFDK